MKGLTSLVVVLASSAAATWALRRYAIRHHLYDQPNHRSSHTVPTPRLGGIAIAAAALGGWFAGRAAGLDDPLLPAVAIGGAAAAVIGAIDDIKGISPLSKLLGEVLAVSVPLVFWSQQSMIPLALFGTAAAALWLLTSMNLFNFMDGSDGLAAGIAVCAAAGIGLLAAQTGAGTVQWMAVAVSAAAAGFLILNYPPASIFMGDAGSLFLGYALGSLALAACLSGTSVVAAALVLLPFLFDAGVTLLRRIAIGEHVWRAHRSHFYQRLLAGGMSHLRVALLYWAWSGLCVMLALLVGGASAPARAVLVAAGLLPGIGVVWLIARRERVRGVAL